MSGYAFIPDAAYMRPARAGKGTAVARLLALREKQHARIREMPIGPKQKARKR